MRNIVAKSILLISGLILCSGLTSCFTVGSFGYLEPYPAKTAVVSENDIVGEYCQLALPQILNKTQQDISDKTGKRSWENVNFRYQPRLTKNCIQMRKVSSGGIQ